MTTITLQEKRRTLVAVRALLAPAGRHTTEVLARRADGAHCEPSDPRAASWCLLGAVYKVLGICGVTNPDMTVDRVRAYQRRVGALLSDLEAARVTVCKSNRHMDLHSLNDTGYVARATGRTLSPHQGMLMLCDAVVARYATEVGI